MQVNMKRTLSVIFLSLLMAAFNVNAQETQPGAFRKFSIGFDFFKDFWVKQPDVVDAKWYSRGANVNVLVNNQMGESLFDFSYGISIGSHNLFTDAWIKDVNKVSVFQKIPDTLHHTKYKINLTYFDFPLEFKYRAKSNWRYYAGIKLGFLINHKSKYSGLDPETYAYHVTIKRDDVRYVNFWRYVVYARIGYKWFNIFGQYTLNPTWKDQQGPEMYPVSAGISIMPF